MAKRLTVNEVAARVDRLEELVKAQNNTLEKLTGLVEKLAAPAAAPAKKQVAKAATPAKKPAKASKPAAKKAAAADVVNYGSWASFTAARRKAAGFGDKFVSKEEFYAALDKSGWEKTHSYRGRFYHHGSPINK